jgi:GNAT superfamily N-acetyltransferase
MSEDDNMASEDTPALGGDETISLAGAGDLAELLPLMRAYCDFYKVDPSDERLTALSRALIEDPEREGLQLLARDRGGTAVGFATVYWSWSTARAGRLGIMNDLFVAERARGRRLAERLVNGCLEQCRPRGALALEWETALDNHRAQVVYDRLGGVRERWLSYSLEIPGA